jgi:hypothetical protein
MISKTMYLFLHIDDEKSCTLNCPDSDAFEGLLTRSRAIGLFRVTDDGSRHIVRDLLTEYSEIEANGTYVFAMPSYHY